MNFNDWHYLQTAKLKNMSFQPKNLVLISNACQNSEETFFSVSKNITFDTQGIRAHSLQVLAHNFSFFDKE